MSAIKRGILLAMLFLAAWLPAPSVLAQADDFSGRTTIPNLPFVSPLTSNANATSEPGEPQHSGISPAKSLWWTWNSGSYSGPVALVAASQQFYPVADAYTGSMLSNLAEVAHLPSNPDVSPLAPLGVAAPGSWLRSQVAFIASPGTDYQIAVDGAYGAAGSFRLTLTVPPALNIDSPADGTWFQEPTVPVRLNATGAPGFGVVTNLQVNLLPFGTFTTNLVARADFNFFGLTAGAYTFWVVATDNLGAQSSTNLHLLVRPINDDFTQRLPLRGLAPTVSWSNLGATNESDEPLHGGIAGSSSVWWTWTAPMSGPVTISVTSTENVLNRSPFLLGIYTGNVLSNLTEIAGNAGVGFSGTSEVTFNAISGTTYQIAVDSVPSAGGPFTLKMVPAAPCSFSILSPTNDTEATWGSPLAVTVAVTNSNRSLQSLSLISSAGPGPSLVGSFPDFFVTNLTFTALQSGTQTIQAQGTDSHGLTGWSASITVILRPPNDNLAEALLLNGSALAAGGTLAGATLEPGEPNFAGGTSSVWYAWSAPLSGPVRVTASTSYLYYTPENLPQLGVFTGDTPANLTPVATNQTVFGASIALAYSQASFIAEAGTLYKIAVAQPNFMAPGERFLLAVTTLPSLSATNSPPTVQFVTPSNGSALAGPTNVSVTIAVTDPEGLVQSVNLFSNGVPIVTFWNEAMPLLSPLSPFGLPQIIRQPFSSLPLTFVLTNVTANLLLTAIAQDNLGATATNTLQITVSTRPPPNDDFAQRTSLTGLPLSVAGYNFAATAETDEPPEQMTYLSYSPSHSVWWSWTAPVTGPIVVTTYGSSFNTILSIYTNDVLSNLGLVACDASSTTDSQVMFQAQAGTTYQISVDGDSGFPSETRLTGTIQLNFSSGLPSLTIDSPLNGAFFPLGTDVPVSGSFATANGVASVQVFDSIQGTTYILTNTPFSFVFANPAAGAHLLQITATDTLGGSVASNVTFNLPQPNDDFSTPLTLSGLAANISSSTSGCTRQSGEPDHAGVPGAHSAWWTWTAPNSGPFCITAQANYDFGGDPLLLGVYTGSNLSNLTTVASGSGSTALAAFQATAGVSYQIAIDGANGASGTFQLRMVYGNPPSVTLTSPLPNSNFIIGSNFLFAAQASPATGSDAFLERVDFYVNSALVGSVPAAFASSGSFSLPWTFRFRGSYSLQAVAVDAQGVASASSVVNVTASLPFMLGRGPFGFFRLGHFQATVTGPDLRQFVVQSSTNLLDWTPLQTNTLVNGAFNFTDPAVAGPGRRFYRALLVPNQ